MHLCGRKVLQEEEQRRRSKVGACLAHSRTIKEAVWLDWMEWAWRLNEIGKVKGASLWGALSDMGKTLHWGSLEGFQ